MSAGFSAFILTLSALNGAAVLSEILTSPTNVHLTSHNMDLVLRWSPPKGSASSLLYTTEYKSSIIDYTAGCVNISTLQCDLTGLFHLSISENGKYTGRVRAHLGSESSSWVESNRITLDKETIIGAPNVSLLSKGATIEVSMKDPVFAVSTLRNVYIFATYNLTYWKDGQKNMARHIKHIQQNLVTLNDLDPWTKYCVEVQIITERNPNPSELSPTVCESTTKEEETPWVAAAVTCAFMVGTVALVVLAVIHRKSVSNFFCPKDTLPQYFKESLLMRHDSMKTSHPVEEIYHQVSIVSDSRPAEKECPREETKAANSQVPPC